MVPIKKFREAVFCVLFAFDNASEVGQNEFLFMQQLSMTKSHIRKAFLKAAQIKSQCSFIDATIQKHSHEYAFDRISQVEKNVLRLALYEMMFEEAIPKPVAIAEGIRIAKKYGSIEGSRFVNALLDAAATAMECCACHDG